MKYLHTTLPLGWDGGGWVVGGAVGDHRGSNGYKWYNKEVLSHSFICLSLPDMEGIVLICNIDLYCLTVILNDTVDMFNR